MKKKRCSSCDKTIDRYHESKTDPGFHDACLSGKFDVMQLKRKLSSGKLDLSSLIDKDIVNTKIKQDQIIQRLMELEEIKNKK